MGLAMMSYHDANRFFPPAFISSSNWGWSVYILPYLEQGNVYSTLNPTTTVLPATPTPATNIPLPIYLCPSDPSSNINNYFGGYAKSNYVVSEQVSDGGSAYSILTITDGTSNTILIGERDMQNQVGAIWAGRFKSTDTSLSGVGSVIGRPNWPITRNWPAMVTMPPPALVSPGPACTAAVLSFLLRWVGSLFARQPAQRSQPTRSVRFS